jgi:hypothetical protein
MLLPPPESFPSPELEPLGSVEGSDVPRPPVMFESRIGVANCVGSSRDGELLHSLADGNVGKRAHSAASLELGLPSARWEGPKKRQTRVIDRGPRKRLTEEDVPVVLYT